MTVEDIVEQAKAIVAGVSGLHPWLRNLRIVGVGWATVEIERAEVQLGVAGCGGWEPAPRDEVLGASVRTCRHDGVELLVLEPDTEGRLAASLARFGEGVVAVYLSAVDPVDPLPGRAARPVDPAGLGKAAPGPLGRARLLGGAPSWGPHVLVLEP